MYQSNIAAAKKRSNNKSKKRDIFVPDDDQQFAVVKSMLGNGRLMALCEDGIERLAKIRGSMRKGPNKTIVNKNDLIVVSARDFEDKVDILHKYTHEEASNMFHMYEIPIILKKAYNNTNVFDDDITNEKNESFEFANYEEDTNIVRKKAEDDDIDVNNI